MHLSVKTRTYLTLVILTLAVIFVMCAKPFHIIKTTYVSHVAMQPSDASELMLFSSEPLTQQFAPQNEQITGLSVYLNTYGTKESDSVLLKLYNASDELLYEGTTQVGVTDGNTKVNFDVNLYADAYHQLHYELYSVDGNEGLITALVAEMGAIGIPEIGGLYYDSMLQEGFSVLMETSYRASLGLKRTLLWDAGVCFAAILLLLYVYFLARPLGKHEGRLRTALCSALTVGVIGIFNWVVIQPTFTTETIDKVFYAIGILSLTAYLYYVILCVGKERKEDPSFAPFVTVRNYLQSIAFAITLYYCCMYVNAARLYDQYTALASIGIWLGLTLLATFEKKDFLNLFNAGWAVIGAVISFLLYTKRDVTEDGKHLSLLISGAIFVFGFLVIYIARHMSRAALKRLSIPMVISWAGYALMMYIFRGNRVWAPYAVITFTTVILYFAVQKDAVRIFKNLSNGISIAFLIVLAFSLARRPYNRWGLSRYPMWYHTVTAGAATTTLTMANAWGHVLAKVKEGGIKNIWENAHLRIVEAAVAGGYLILAISRTGILTVFLFFVVTLVLYVIAERKSMKKVLKSLAIMLCTLVLTFFTVFTATRVVPAVVSDPFRFPNIPFEDEWYLVQAGEPLDSEWYMNVDTFLLFLDVRFTNGTSESDEVMEANKKNNEQINKQSETQDTSKSKANNLHNSGGKEATTTVEVDLSNGRFDIWKACIKELGFAGHETMSIELPDGTTAYHAHNCYLQEFYDFGIIGGLFFLALCLLAFLRGCKAFIASVRGQKESIMMIPIVTICAFGVTGMVEFTSVPMTAITLFFLLTMSLFCIKDSETNI